MAVPTCLARGTKLADWRYQVLLIVGTKTGYYSIEYDPSAGLGQVDDILRLLNGLCVTEAVTGRKMIASGIENRDIESGGGSQ